ncbi:TetR family transcriptional regulator [Mycobacterium sp. E1214]|nr:TetR family transcriptional regulator [Mycobacterium sp. E1214]
MQRGLCADVFRQPSRRADLTRPAINHYFSSKRTLYREVLDETNKFIIGAGIERAYQETGLAAQLTTFISVAVRGNIETMGGSAMIISGVLESQRHPEWNTTENDSVRLCRDFLNRIVNDAVTSGEVPPDVDVPALIEALLVLLCGVGLYAGFVQGPEALLSITGMMRRLLEGAFRRSADLQ